MLGFPDRALPDRAAYDYLTRASRADLAWEWLRRNPGYRALTPGVRCWTDYGWIVDAGPEYVAAQWGCLHVENPERRASETSIIWSATFDPTVLRIVASPSVGWDGATLDLRCHAASATIVVDAGGCEHISIETRTEHTVRLDIIAGTLLDGPKRLRLDLDGATNINGLVTGLERLLYLWEGKAIAGRNAAGCWPSRRSIDALCVYDALVEGATIRDIGTILFGRDRIVAEWRAPGESLKSYCRRIISFAKFMADGGYKTLLR